MMDTKIDRKAEDIRARHIRRQKQRRQTMLRRRMIFFFVSGLILLSIILFFTPLFNIRNVNILGNSRVNAAQIKQVMGSVEGENLFRLNTKRMITNAKTIPYVDDVVIKKKMFSVAVDVNVSECVPIGCIENNDKYIVVDKNFKVLEFLDAPMENAMQITGVSVVAATEGAVITTDDSENLEVMTQVCTELMNQGIFADIGTISFQDIYNISFNYQNRLDVVCGSVVDFSKKIGMFKKAVSSSKLNENSRGTIDISKSGQATYKP